MAYNGPAGNGRNIVPPYEARFPDVPTGFDVAIKAERLSPGEYMVFVDAGLPQILQSFRVP